MESFLDALFEYAQEKEIVSYLETREYRRATSDLEEHWAAFRSTLTAEQTRILDALLNRERNAACLEDQAIFSCGLSMGVGLGRL